MNIQIIVGTNRDDFEWQKMKIDDKETLYVHALCQCPEDAIIERSLISCKQISALMQEAYDAGKRGEEFTVTVVPENS